jgi:hypothetical protein
MPQPVYPTTLPNPDVEGFVRTPAIDPVERTRVEDGPPLVMRTKTFVPRRWTLVYRELTETQMNTIVNFWEGDANCGAVVVKYADSTNNTAYWVRFAAMPDCQLEHTQQQRWRVVVQFEQDPGSYV